MSSWIAALALASALSLVGCKSEPKATDKPAEPASTAASPGAVQPAGSGSAAAGAAPAGSGSGSAPGSGSDSDGIDDSDEDCMEACSELALCTQTVHPEERFHDAQGCINMCMQWPVAEQKQWRATLSEARRTKNCKKVVK